MPEIVGKVIMVVVGALLGILLPAVRDLLSRKLRRPNVAIEVGGHEGCIYDNVLIKSYGNSGSVSQTGRDAIFIRARVMNRPGRFTSPAKVEGAVGYLAGLVRWDADRQRVARRAGCRFLCQRGGQLHRQRLPAVRRSAEPGGG